MMRATECKTEASHGWRVAPLRYQLRKWLRLQDLNHPGGMMM